MINFKKHGVLLVGGGVCLVLLIVVSVILFRAMNDYQSVARDKQRAESRLNQLNQRDPFPSLENIEATRANLDVLNEQLSSLMKDLRRREFEIESIEPAQFAPMMERAYNRVAELATAANVTIPDRIQFGFDQYARGTLPASRHIPRLVRQLKTLEYVGELLVNSRITQLVSIRRVEFEILPDEEEEDARTGRRGAGGRAGTPAPTTATAVAMVAPAIATNALYRTERVHVVFTGRESAVWEALTQIVASPIFIQITDIRMENLAREVGRPIDLRTRAQALSRAAPTAATPTRVGVPGGELAVADIPRDERIVGGRELIQATLVLDVFTFIPGESGQQEETL
ncbi:MAG TPA: Amuc_1100 family pilus-like protein [Kiritimatiellia bacterium]|nr:Amuc_1100 family pilus-like protein [Kiritimatiellia bacterium]